MSCKKKDAHLLPCRGSLLRCSQGCVEVVQRKDVGICSVCGNRHDYTRYIVIQLFCYWVCSDTCERDLRNSFDQT